MGCGCGSKEKKVFAKNTQPHKPRAKLPFEESSRAAICDACPHVVYVDERPTTLPYKQRAAVCGINRKPIVACVTIAGCPIGAFPDPQTQIVMWPRWAGKDGKLACKGIAWIGLPFPLRLWVAIRTGLVRDWPGCGCVRFLKERIPLAGGLVRVASGATLAAVVKCSRWWHSQYEEVRVRDAKGQTVGSVMRLREGWEPIAGSHEFRERIAWFLVGLVMLACFVLAVV
jgi:hypothetical protein